MGISTSFVLSIFFFFFVFKSVGSTFVVLSAPSSGIFARPGRAFMNTCSNGSWSTFLILPRTTPIAPTLFSPTIAPIAAVIVDVVDDDDRADVESREVSFSQNSKSIAIVEKYCTFSSTCSRSNSMIFLQKSNRPPNSN